MPTREQTRDAWRIVHARAATERLTIDDPAAGAHVCRFCGGETGDAGMPVHALDCPYLAAHQGGDLTRTRAEIEGIIGCPLPESAYVTSGYWIDKDAPLVRWMQAHGWQATLRIKARAVLFRRMAGKEHSPNR